MGHADEFYMSKALALAERGRGTTSPNPMVGAVLVDDEGVIVGRGAHQVAGGPHAEIHAIDDAGERARGATLYCTLEPCSHTGRTGPCAPRVIAAGISRAVIAMEDPNPLVAGRGLSLLREAGLHVTVGPLGDAAERLNRPFLTMMRRRRPFVTVKAALSADYAVAAAPGACTPLTGVSAARLVHRERAEIDALVVGSGTILADDPLLTPRIAWRRRPLVRVVFDARLRTPPGARVLSTLSAGPVIIVTSPSALSNLEAPAGRLRDAGATIEVVPEEAGLGGALERLAGRGISSLLVEGGTVLHQAFWNAGLVDRIQLFVTPHVLGSGAVRWLPFSQLAGAAWKDVQARVIDSDILIEAHVHRPD